MNNPYPRLSLTFTPTHWRLRWAHNPGKRWILFVGPLALEYWARPRT